MHARSRVLAGGFCPWLTTWSRHMPHACTSVLTRHTHPAVTQALPRRKAINFFALRAASSAAVGVGVCMYMYVSDARICTCTHYLLYPSSYSYRSS
jgi:hypothetical protein